MAAGAQGLPKMMLGFVVRRCAAALGHPPTAEEFAAWANNYQEGERTVSLFGRQISVAEARLILRHPARPVTARGARPAEQGKPDDELPANVVRFPSNIRRRSGGAAK